MDPLPVAPPRRKRKGNKSFELKPDRQDSGSSNSDLKQQLATSDSEGTLGSPLENSTITPSAVRTPPPEVKIESSITTRSAARAKPARPEPPKFSYNPFKKHSKSIEFLGNKIQAHQKTVLTRSTSTSNSQSSPPESQKKALSRSKSAETREEVHKSQTPAHFYGKSNYYTSMHASKGKTDSSEAQKEGKPEPKILDSRGKKERQKAARSDQMHSGKSSSTTSKANVESKKSFASMPQANPINSSNSSNSKSDSPKRLTKQVSRKNFKMRPLPFVPTFGKKTKTVPAASGHDVKYDYVDPNRIRALRNTEMQISTQLDGLDLTTYYVMDNYKLDEASPSDLKQPAPTYAKINPMSVTHNEYAVPLGPGTTKALNSPTGKGTTPLSANSCKPIPSKDTANYNNGDFDYENATFGGPSTNGIKKTGATRTSIDDQEEVESSSEHEYMPMSYETMDSAPIYEFVRKKSI